MVAARGMNVTGPGSAFDESPKEPIPAEVQKMSAALMLQMQDKVRVDPISPPLPTSVPRAPRHASGGGAP